MSKYKAIIFDLDGLLIDTEIISYQIYVDLINPYGCNMSKKYYAENFSGKPEIINSTKIVNDYKIPMEVNAFINEVARLENIYFSKGVKLKKGARHILSYLKKNGYKIGLATSSTKAKVDLVLTPHNLLIYFDTITTVDNITHGKPNPEIFLKAQSSLACSKEETLILEDSETGIECANNAEIDVCCIPDMKIPSEYHLKLAKYQKDNLNQVIEIFEN